MNLPGADVERRTEWRVGRTELQVLYRAEVRRNLLRFLLYIYIGCRGEELLGFIRLWGRLVGGVELYIFLYKIKNTRRWCRVLLLFVIWFCLLFFIVIRFQVKSFCSFYWNWNCLITTVAVQDRFTRKVQNEFTWGGRRKTDRMTFWADGITGVI